MPISQLTERCWALRPETVSNDQDPHFRSKADAERRAKLENLTGAPELLPEPCWTIACDGPCDALLDEEGDGYIFHEASRASAEKLATDFGWIITEDGRAICDYDVKENPACLEAVAEVATDAH